MTETLSPIGKPFWISLIHACFVFRYSNFEFDPTPDVGTLLVELADCIDLPWAEALGEFALRYAAEWNGGGMP